MACTLRFPCQSLRLENCTCQVPGYAEKVERDMLEGDYMVLYLEARPALQLLVERE